MSSYPSAPVGGGWQPPPKHPQATLVLILGILGLAVCGVLAPVAWVMGNRALREIDANPQQFGGRSEANAGRILGIVGTAFLAIGLLLLVALLAFGVLGLLVSASSY
ncbi:DUF4190 domain-containing protein [Aeromicrobium phragmitis]|uniref:DUF4190 domain-containing protein n=1 Tax=Aeromicrobium phragmitis TaxID=2478914 RepID=A0A3L8PNZ3_9ACTN|nr:DUF4190 domain-containing protein [Aeromicrobium phragmitis]RLV56423.1 DUF4190 domain-containing protein [Aeromicrobium phragmitis]